MKGIFLRNMKVWLAFCIGVISVIPVTGQETASITPDAETADVISKDVNLELVFSEVDSIKTLTINASTLSSGSVVPITGETVKIYIPRMFSLYPVTEAVLDESGSASVEFPSDLPGDSAGNIKILVKFDEYSGFAGVEKSTLQKWGVPTTSTIDMSHRALWTKTPPWWMIITLSILLLGVWGHYMFAVISLILIRRDAKKKQLKDDYKI